MAEPPQNFLQHIHTCYHRNLRTWRVEGRPRIKNTVYINSLPGQVLKLQGLVVWPLHSAPPFVALNFVNRVFVPDPQVLLHFDQSDHSQLTEIFTR